MQKKLPTFSCSLHGGLFEKGRPGGTGASQSNNKTKEMAWSDSSSVVSAGKQEIGNTVSLCAAHLAKASGASSHVTSSFVIGTTQEREPSPLYCMRMYWSHGNYGGFQPLAR